MYYCVDLWHDNYLGSTYTITPVGNMVFSNSAFADVDNRIGWLLKQDQSTPGARAAVQLGIWYTVDNKPGVGSTGFSMSTGDPAITSRFDQLIDFDGYDSKKVYSADFWAATHDPSNTLYQDLVSDPGIGFGARTVPEPSTFVLGCICLIGLAAAVVRRHAR
jgi:hypothetical protein